MFGSLNDTRRRGFGFDERKVGTLCGGDDDIVVVITAIATGSAHGPRSNPLRFARRLEVQSRLKEAMRRQTDGRLRPAMGVPVLPTRGWKGT